MSRAIIRSPRELLSFCHSLSHQSDERLGTIRLAALHVDLSPKVALSSLTLFWEAVPGSHGGIEHLQMRFRGQSEIHNQN